MAISPRLTAMSFGALGWEGMPLSRKPTARLSKGKIAAGRAETNNWEAGLAAAAVLLLALAAMKRRNFLAMPLLGAAGVGMGRAGAAADDLPAKWRESLRYDQRYTAESYEAPSAEGIRPAPRATLEVELDIAGGTRVEALTGEDGVVKGYKVDGKAAPAGYSPGASVLRKFKLRWDGKEVPIAERFWSDLLRLEIVTSDLTTKQVGAEQVGQLIEFHAKLRHPRVMISAEEGTLLIEWARPEEDGGQSTIRWIVSRTGTVLRHRLQAHGG